MKKILVALIPFFAFAALAAAVGSASIDLYDEGVLNDTTATKGIDCVGAGIECTVNRQKAQITVTNSLSDGGVGVAAPPSTPYCGDGGTAIGWTGTEWSCTAISIPSTAAVFLAATLSAAQTTHIASDDHIAFNTVEASNGSDISLDTATAYSNVNGVASVGQFTLAANHTYRLRVDLGSATTSQQIQYSWVDSSDGSAIGQGGLFLATVYAGTNSASSSGAEAVVVVGGSPKTVDVRMTFVAGTSSIGSTSIMIDAGLISVMPHVYIEELQ